MKKINFIILCCLALSLLSCNRKLAVYQVGNNDKIIMQSDLVNLIKEYPEELFSLRKNIDVQKQYIRELAINDLAAEQAINEGIDKTPEFKNKWNAIYLWYLRNKYSLKLLKKHHADIVNNHKEEIIFVKSILIKIDSNKADLPQPELDKLYKLAYKKAMEAIGLLKRGEKFAQVAFRYSSGVSKHNGGVIGYIIREKFEPVDKDFSDAAFNLPVNELSQPVKSQKLKGYHIILVTDRRKVGLHDCHSLKTDVYDRNRLIYAMQDILLRKMFSKLESLMKPIVEKNILTADDERVIIKFGNKNILTKKELISLLLTERQLRKAVKNITPDDVDKYAQFLKEAYFVQHEIDKKGISMYPDLIYSLNREKNKLLRGLIEQGIKKQVSKNIPEIQVYDEYRKIIEKKYEKQKFKLEYILTIDKEVQPYHTVKKNLETAIYNRNMIKKLNDWTSSLLLNGKYKQFDSNFKKLKVNL